MATQIPEDLMELDLPMSKIKQILFAREQRRKAETVLSPSEKRIANARARIAWAQQAEQAIRAGQTPPDMPRFRGDAEDTD